MVSAVVDTSAIFALLDADDGHHDAAVLAFDANEAVDLVVHGYVIAESLALLRARLGRPAVVEFIDGLLPALRTAMVDREVHDAALAAHRAMGGGTSFVDRVTIAFARHEGIEHVFGFDTDIEAGGLTALR